MSSPDPEVEVPVEEPAPPATPPAASDSTLGQRPLESPGEPVETWQQEFLDTDLRGDPTLGRYKNVNELGRAYLEARTKLSTKGTVKPSDESSDEEWGAFWNDLGRPESSDKYDLKELNIPEGLPGSAGNQFPEIQENWIKSAHELGMTQKQTVGMLQSYYDEMNSTWERVNSDTAQRHNDWDREIRQEWGSAYDEKFDLADRAIHAALGTDMAQHIAQLPLPGGGVFGAHPGILRMFAEIGSYRAEAGLLGDKVPTRFAKTPEEAQNEIAKLKASSEFRRQFAAKEPEATEKWDALHRQAFPEEPRG